MRNRPALRTLLLATTFVLGISLRVAWPTLVEFKLDEATTVRHALAIAWNGERPLVGMGSSVGMANLPLTFYLTALPLRIWSDPVAAVLFIGLLNGLAVPACYWLGRTYFNRRVGWIAAYLFAVNPWAILLGRKLWPKVLPLVVVALMGSLMATFIHRRRWALVAAFAALAALVGLQLEGIAFIPIVALALLFYRKEVSGKPLLVGLAVFLLALAPYGIHDALHGWPNLRAFGEFLRQESRFSWDALRYAFVLTGSAEIHTMAGSLYPDYQAGLPRLWWLNTGMMGLLALALMYAVFQALRGPQETRRAYVLLLLWFAVPVLLRSRAVRPIPLHYLLLLYPGVFLLIAALLDGVDRSLPERFRHPARAIALGMGVLWGIWQLAVWGRLLLFMNNHPTTGGYGIPLKYPRQAAVEARRLAEGAEIFVLSEGAEPAFEETPAVLDALLFRTPHRLADGRMTIPVPDAPRAVYIVGPVPAEGGGPLQPVEQRLQELDGVRPGPAALLPDGWAYRLYLRERPDREDVLEGLARFPDRPRFANGVTLLGYALPERVGPGETLEIWLAWWVEAPPPPGSDYHFFSHLVDEAEHLRGQHDGVPFPTASWRAGDLMLSRFSIPTPPDLPAGTYSVRVGMYTYPDLQGVPVLDVAGNPAAGFVVLGEVKGEE